MKSNTQSPKDAFWIDEQGVKIPFKRITYVERLKERSSSKLLREALGINKRLSAFKLLVQEHCSDVYSEFMKEANNETVVSKGNFSWFNFDRSIKIEVAVKERIEFDDLGVIACKDKLNSFISANVDSQHDFIKQMILDAFETSKGKLDVKKALGLLRYKDKVNDVLFLEAMHHLETAIRRPDSKSYFRIYGREEDGSYTLIDLNFSSIK